MANSNEVIVSSSCLPGNELGYCEVCSQYAVLQGTRYVDGHVDGFCSHCGQQYVWG